MSLLPVTLRVLGYDIETDARGKMRSPCGTVHVTHTRADGWGSEAWCVDVRVNEDASLQGRGATLKDAETKAAAAIRRLQQDCVVTLCEYVD